MIFGVKPGHWVGIPILLMAFPLGYLLLKAPEFNRPTIYYIQVSTMLVWLIVLFLVDYVLKYDFRQTQWMVISYVVLAYAGLGGMIGIAALAGRGWTISAIILFLIAAILGFVQRAVTGF
jgi:predicted permease